MITDNADQKQERSIAEIAEYAEKFKNDHRPGGFAVADLQ